MIRTLIAAAGSMMLLSCSASGEDATPVGGLTAGEAAQLEKAAERLDARPHSPAREASEALETQSRAELEAQRREIDAR